MPYVLRTPAGRAADPTWGVYPAGAEAAALPGERRARSVLEVFLWGGISPWETLYTIPRDDYGYADRQMWWTFQEGPDSVAEWAYKCTGADPVLIDNAVDELGVEVFFGPFMAPLSLRTDITARLRTHVISHDLFPHEGAVVLAASGTRLGLPRVASVGAAVQRALGDESPSGLPVSYVIGNTDNVAFTGVGHHPAATRPLAMDTQRLSTYAESWRSVVADPPDAEVVAALLRDQADVYARRFEVPVPGVAPVQVRARAVDDVRFALAMRDRAPALADVVADPAFAVHTFDHCGAFGLEDVSGASLRLAAALIKDPTIQARHVTVVDQAYGPWDNHYDTHAAHIRTSASTHPYLWARLSEVINTPGENDPGKLDLDETLIVINTEFGRSPGLQIPDGRNHYPTAYATAMIGGPVDAAARGIVGAIGPYANPVDALSPAATRAASLVALGIWPFDAGGYFASEVGHDTQLGAALLLRDRVLGFVP